MRFGGKVAIVTGGGSGIGRATAIRLAKGGAVVCIFDINEKEAQATKVLIAEAGGIAESFTVDISDSTQIVAALEVVETQLGTPTIVINCAGILHVAEALDTTEDEFDHVILVNLRSVFLLCTSAARKMIGAHLGGAIVNVSSIHAAISEPNASAYTAAKGGVEAMSRTFASEWAKYNIRVNCARPGATRTALTDSIYTPQVLDALSQRVPMKRPAEPDQIAAGICFLASDDANYCTGTTLDLDGGYIMDGSLPRVVYE